MNNFYLIVLGLTIIAFILNLPFGYLRSHHKKMTFMWLLYINAPVPVVVALRLLVGVSYKYIPILLAGVVLGQLIGGKFNKARVS